MQLLEAKLINPDIMKKLEPKIGEVLITRLPKPIIFSLVIKENGVRDKNDLNNIKLALKELKRVMLEGEIETARIARVEDGLDKFPCFFLLAKAIRAEFDCKPFVITICSCELKVPPEEIRQKIISEAHDAIVAGHKGLDKTYKRIKERYCWKGMKKDIENYIRTCES